jgi:ribosomal protein S18 acetylase RimI-like enzyme
MRPIIRKATSEDLSTLLIFEQDLILTERPFDKTLKPGKIQYYDLEKMITAPHVELMVAELEGELIGCGYARIENAKPYLLHQQHAYLGFMYVKPLYRGKGVNKLIMDALANWSAAENITELRLDVYTQNDSAISAYLKSGFVKHMLQMRRGLTK